MNRSIRLGIFLLVPIVSVASSGCTYEDDEKDRQLQITGTVSYNGKPVKKGTIHFLPVVPGAPPATGAIADGEIKDVFTRIQGDGIKPGEYKLAITSFDEAFLRSVAKRDFGGPDPVEVAKAADKVKKLIPARYSNPRESGLTAQISPSSHTLRLELVD